MEGGDNVGQRGSSTSLYDTRTAAGEGNVEESNPAHRLIQEGRADHSDEYREFLLENSEQLARIGVPDRYWGTLYKKLTEEIFDGGSYCMLCPLEEEESGIPVDSRFKVVVSDSTGLRRENENNLFLVDHACTWRSKEELKFYIANMEGLKERLAGILNVDQDDYDCSSEIVRRSYQRSGTYPYLSQPSFDVWYLNDELGSRIRHSSAPSVRLAVFNCFAMGGAYTIMWPVRDICHGEEVTQDFVREGTNEIRRELILCAYGLESNLPEVLPYISKKKPIEWFTEWKSIISENCSRPIERTYIRQDSTSVLKVYSDIKSLVEAESELFDIVEEITEADVIWQADHWKDFDIIRSDQLISQFPNEHLLTTKVCLSEVAKRCRNEDGNEQHPVWFSDSYDIRTEVEDFVARYNKNEADDADNHWILKAWNFAHGNSTIISNDLLEIVRHRDCSIPYIIQKYITRPVLLGDPKLKFDFRYHVVVKSFQPLKGAILKRFWPKFAAHPYDMENTDDLRAHLTNIAVSEERDQPWYTEFIKQFEEETGFSWETDVQKPAVEAIKTCLHAVASGHQDGKVIQIGNSRALYGVDIMLEESDQGITPKILEFNFNCDCSRVAEIVPTFYDEVIDFIYLDNWDRLDHIDLTESTD